MADNTVEVLIKLRDQLSGELDKATQKLKSFDKSLILLGASATAVTGTLAYALKKALDTAAVQEKAELTLAAAMQKRGVFTEEAHRQLVQYAGALQRVTAYGDEEIITVEATLARFGAQGEKLRELTRLTLDLAQAKGLDLAQASFIVGKAIGSEVNALARLGVEIKGAAGSAERMQSAIDGLNRVFGGAAAAFAQTYEGRVRQLKAAIGDLYEALSMWMLPTLKQLIVRITEFVHATTAWISAHREVIKWVAVAVGWIAGTYGLVQALIAAKAAIIGLRVAFQLLTGPIGWVSLAVTGAIVAWIKWRREITEGVVKALEFLLRAVNAVVGGISGLLNKIGVHWLDGAKEAIDGAIAKLREWDDKLDELQAKAKTGAQTIAFAFDQTAEAVSDTTDAIEEATESLDEYLTRVDELTREASIRTLKPRLRMAPEIQTELPDLGKILILDAYMEAEATLVNMLTATADTCITAADAISSAFGSAFQQMLAQGTDFCDALKAAFKSMVAHAIAEVTRLIAKVILLGTLKRIFGIRFAGGGLVPAYQTGGVVTWLAPKRGIIAELHPGEMVLNQEQQKRLFALLAGRATPARSAPTIVINTMDAGTLEHEIRYGRLGQIIREVAL
jgi:methyl-accepting chemotaxis protein